MRWQTGPVRLAAALTTLAAGLIMSAPPAALASDAVASHTAERVAEPGTVVCTVDDPRAVELSGLVATADGYVSEIDSQFNPDQIRIVYLDQSCRVTRTVGYPTPARDPEDLAVAPDGTLWVADTGDNLTAATHRQTVALWKVPSAGGSPVIHRLTYPDGSHDAEAVLFSGDGSPIIVTKELGGTAFLYQATGPLQPNTAPGVPMRRVGEFRPIATGASNTLGAAGELLVTGAATSPDRRRVALRTYTAAYEWDVPDGDVVKAITTSTPRVTALPDEPQGEAIAYTMDGQNFLTLSDESGPTTLRSYERSTRPAAPAATSAAPTVAAPAPAVSTPMLWYGFALAGLGGGALIVALGWFGLRRARRAD